MADAILSAARLRELVSYDPTTGEFVRLKNTYRHPQLIGKVINPVAAGNGYVYISVDGKPYLAHRLAWLYVYGEWPERDTDHINCDRTDNRIENLRDVERHVNNQNRSGTRADNKSSGLTGVTWHNHSRKWRARIWLHGKEHRLGLFDTTEEAYDAYVAAKRKLHEGCTI
jgi:hypothetical protein